MARIAFVSTLKRVPWGASEDLWAATAETFAARGHDVHASYTRWPEPPQQVRQMQAAGITIAFRDEGRTSKSLWASGRRRLCRSLGITHARWLDRIRPDLLVINQATNAHGADWMLACRERGIPYVTLCMSAGTSTWPDDQEAAWLATGYLGAAGAYFVSRSNIAITQRQIGETIPQAETVACRINISRDAHPPWPDTTDEYRLATVGRLDFEHKGLDILFDVLAMPAWRGLPMTVTVVGGGRNERTVKKLAEANGLEGIVTFAGIVDSIEDVWANHHALLMTSRLEGWPLVLAEAMLCGRIAIATNVGLVPEAVTDGVTGFVAPAPTIGDLHDAMTRAWAQRERWQEMGQAAAEAIRPFTPPDPGAVLADRLLQLLS